MNPPCEIVVQKILPVIRSEIAKELKETHKLTQKEIARALNITQPAVSQYIARARGYSTITSKDRQLKKMISDFAKELKNGKLDGNKKIEFFCGVCRHCRKTALICKFHGGKKSDCNICLVELKCD